MRIEMTTKNNCQYTIKRRRYVDIYAAVVAADNAAAPRLQVVKSKYTIKKYTIIIINYMYTMLSCCCLLKLLRL